MSSWIIALFLLFCCAAGIFLIYRRTRKRRQNRLKLRLLAGRSQLLEGEITNQIQNLRDFDEDQLNTLRLEAENALNLLQITLIERQAHLLNYEDLAHLQRFKLDILNHASAQLQTQATTTAPHPTETTALAPAQPGAETAPKDRSSIENELLSKINKLNQANKRGGQSPKK
jgi:hypothetical protein